MAPKKTYYADSDDSSSTDGADEKPSLSRQSGVQELINTMSSESESSSNDEDEMESSVESPAPKKQAVVKAESDSITDTESDKGSAQVPGYAPTTAPTLGFKTKAGLSSGSVHSVVAKIEAYLNSSLKKDLHMSPNLNSYERLLAHDCAERLGLEHASVGVGLERHIVVSKSEKHSLQQSEDARPEKKRRSN